MNCPACDHQNVEGARYCAKCGTLVPVANNADDDALINQVVGGRYRITGLLGEGGMGRVYTAEQQMGTAVRKVAVKTLLQEFSRDPQVVARFMRECGTVVQLEHPNTIKFYDFGQTDAGDLYIAMEFVSGKSLADVIETDGAMSFARVDHIMKQMCGSLHEAHEKGVIHRDLKPDNVILTTRAGEADFVKVLDFGIAKRQGASDSAKEQKLTQAGMVLGTPPYMSPEQFTGKELDRRSDIYSLGVLAYEMLTGQLPFKANTAWEWATQHMTQQPFPFDQTGPLAAQVPPNMKAAIMRALSKDPDQRQATAKAFYNELKVGAAAATAPVGPSAPGGYPPPPQAGAAAATAPVGPSAPGGYPPPPQAGAAPVGGGTGTQVGPAFVPPATAMGMPANMGGPQMGGPQMGGPQMGGPQMGGPQMGGPQMGGHANLASGAQAIPPPPSNYDRQNGGGNKTGLIVGAVAVALALVGGGIFFFGRSSSGDEDETAPIVFPTTVATAADDDGAPADDKGEGGAHQTAQGDGGTDPIAARPEPTPASHPGSKPHPTPHPTPPPPPPPPPKPDPKPTPKPATGSAACEAAIAAALSKRCSAARSAFNRCSGFRKKTAQLNIARHCR